MERACALPYLSPLPPTYCPSFSFIFFPHQGWDLDITQGLKIWENFSERLRSFSSMRACHISPPLSTDTMEATKPGPCRLLCSHSPLGLQDQSRWRRKSWTPVQPGCWTRLAPSSTFRKVHHIYDAQHDALLHPFISSLVCESHVAGMVHVREAMQTSGLQRL